jgi:hypothetical protein
VDILWCEISPSLWTENMFFVNNILTDWLLYCCWPSPAQWFSIPSLTGPIQSLQTLQEHFEIRPLHFYTELAEQKPLGKWHPRVPRRICTCVRRSALIFRSYSQKACANDWFSMPLFDVFHYYRYFFVHKTFRMLAILPPSSELLRGRVSK